MRFQSKHNHNNNHVVAATRICIQFFIEMLVKRLCTMRKWCHTSDEFQNNEHLVTSFFLYLLIYIKAMQELFDDAVQKKNQGRKSQQQLTWLYILNGTVDTLNTEKKRSCLICLFNARERADWTFPLLYRHYSFINSSRKSLSEGFYPSKEEGGRSLRFKYFNK